MSQSVNLVLKSTQISLIDSPLSYYNKTVTSSNGSISNNRSAFKFININMKTLLGDMYERYERFSISLNFIAGAATGQSIEQTPDNRCFQVKLSGLPFTSSYNQQTANNNGIVVLTAIQVPLTANTTWVDNYLTPQYFTFTKQAFVDLSIELDTIDTDYPYVPADYNSLLGHCIFSFNIDGLTEFENSNITSHRMDLKGGFN